MENKKYIAASVLAGSMLFTVGCSNGVNESSISTQETMVSSTEENENVTVGKVSKIEANNITIKIGTLNMPQGGMKDSERPEMPQDGERPEIPSGERPEMPQGDKPEMPNGERPEMPQGDKPSDKENREVISLTGEEEMIVLSSDIKIIRMSGGKGDGVEETLSVTDIQVDDVLKINYSDNGEIESVEVMSFGKMEAPDKNDSNKNKEA